jgi:putative peptidoglycan lipid II flippase
MQKSILTGALAVSVGVLLGRIAGFFREVSLAATFGLSPEADIAVVLLTVPDALVNLLAAGALSVALIPEFKRVGPGLRSDTMFVQASVVAAVVFSGIAVLAILMIVPLLSVTAPGFSGEKLETARSLLPIALCVLPLTILAGVSTARLQAGNRFLVAALGTFIYNGVLIAAILFFLIPADPLRTLAWAIIAAAGLRWLSQLLQLRAWRWNLRSLRLPLLGKPVLLRYSQALGAAGAITLMPIVARAFASQNGHGDMALFNYAYKLVELPLGGAVTVIAVVVFPMLSLSFQRSHDATDTIRMALRWVFALALALTCTLVVFRELLASAAFGWGRMPQESLGELAGLFGLGLLSLPMQGLSSILVAIFNARLDTATPMRVNATVVLAYVPLAWILGKIAGLQGIMLALVVANLVMLLAQAVLLNRRHRIAVWSLLRPAQLCAGVAVCVSLAVAAAWFRDAFDPGLVSGLVGAGLVGVVILLAGLRTVGSPLLLPRKGS